RIHERPSHRERHRQSRRDRTSRAHVRSIAQGRPIFPHPSARRSGRGYPSRAAQGQLARNHLPRSRRFGGFSHSSTHPRIRSITMGKLLNLLAMFGPLRAAKLWVAAAMAVVAFVRVYFGIELGLVEETATAVIGGLGALLVWLVHHANPTLPDY